jgi:hypothetical protein
MVILLVGVLAYFPDAGSRWPWNLADPAITLALLFTLPLLGSYVLVRRYYQKEEGRKTEPSSIPTSSSEGPQ